MTLKNLNKAPFPWFGGKSRAASLVWSLLGDVNHYVEPFAGSLAVLLNRPHPCNRTYYSETVNDLDGFVVNAWRAIQWHPEETAAAASWPVTEADKTARQAYVLRWRDEKVLDLLAGSPEWCDPKVAGWWLWGVCCQIGAFRGDGAWISDPISGRLIKQPRLPREPGVSRDIPHLANNGVGINRPQMREPGVLSDDPANEFHQMTMPELIRWFQWLSARLRHVRIVNGDWARAVTTGVLWTLPVRLGGHVGVFLDPPYDTSIRSKKLYQNDNNIATDCHQWCIKNGDNSKNRIVLAGYDTEHQNLEQHGWIKYEWFTDGFLTGGLSNVSKTSTHQQHRERLWASPHCLIPNTLNKVIKNIEEENIS